MSERIEEFKIVPEKTVQRIINAIAPLKSIAKTNEEWAAYLEKWVWEISVSMSASYQWLTDDERHELQTKIMAMRIAADAIRQVGPFALSNAVSNIRPPVYLFACLMENKLRKHDADRGPRSWLDGTFTIEDAYERMMQETRELRFAIEDGNQKDIRSEAADVGNFAMMICDLTGMDK